MDKRIKEIMKYDDGAKYMKTNGIITERIIELEVMYNMNRIISKMSDVAIKELIDAALVSIKQEGDFLEQPLETFFEEISN